MISLRSKLVPVLTILGVLFLIGGVVVLAMKVSRRNDADLR